MSDRLTTLEFIKKAHKTHGKRFDYSQVKYRRSNIKITIGCPSHGIFYQTPNNHLRGQGCPKCSLLRKALLFSSGKEDFIKKAHKTHGDRFDYSEIEYKNNRTKIRIICPIHGLFEQTPSNHLKYRCNSCGNKIIAQKLRKIVTQEQFIKIARKVHGNVYDYSQVYIGESVFNRINIICPKHGPFFQSVRIHMLGGQCPSCSRHRSKPEVIISSLLREQKINFIEQYRIPECRNLLPLPFDFAVFKNEKLLFLIEYHGQQHYLKNSFYETRQPFRERKRLDRKKEKFCVINNIPLYTISYLDNLENKVTGILRRRRLA